MITGKQIGYTLKYYQYIHLDVKESKKDKLTFYVTFYQ